MSEPDFRCIVTAPHDPHDWQASDFRWYRCPGVAAPVSDTSDERAREILAAHKFESGSRAPGLTWVGRDHEPRCACGQPMTMTEWALHIVAAALAVRGDGREATDPQLRNRPEMTADQLEEAIHALNIDALGNYDVERIVRNVILPAVRGDGEARGAEFEALYGQAIKKCLNAKQDLEDAEERIDVLQGRIEAALALCDKWEQDAKAALAIPGLAAHEDARAQLAYARVLRAALSGGVSPATPETGDET